MSTVNENLSTGLQLIQSYKLGYAVGSIATTDYTTGDTVVIETPSRQILSVTLSSGTANITGAYQGTGAAYNIALSSSQLATHPVYYTIVYVKGSGQQIVNAVLTKS